MITLNDKKKKFLEINAGNLSPEGKLKEIEKYLAEADKLNEKEQKDLEKQKEDDIKKQEKEAKQAESDAKKEESDQKKADAQEKSDASTKNIAIPEPIELRGVKYLEIKGDKGDTGEPGPIGPVSTKPGPRGLKGEPGESIVGPQGEPGKDGKNAEPNEVVPLVMNQLNLPEVKELVLDTPSEIKDKLETLKGDARLDAKSIKNLPNSQTFGGGQGGGGGVYVEGRNIDISLNTVSLDIPVQSTPPENPVLNMLWIDDSP